VSSSRTRKKKGAPSGAPSRTTGRAARRKAADRGVIQRLAAPVALILAALLALGSLGYWVQSRTNTAKPELFPGTPANRTSNP
jgi:hypothetical protein